MLLSWCTRFKGNEKKKLVGKYVYKLSDYKKFICTRSLFFIRLDCFGEFVARIEYERK